MLHLNVDFFFFVTSSSPFGNVICFVTLFFSLSMVISNTPSDFFQETVMFPAIVETVP